MGDNTLPQLLESIVVHGQQLGRKLGFRTANLDTAGLGQTPLVPGVYAAWATLQNGEVYVAMVNIGYRPTVDSQLRYLSVEAHLDNFDGDLYGQMLSLNIVQRIRNERKMNSLDELRQQLASDLIEVRKILRPIS